MTMLSERKKMNILLIDDNEMDIEITKEALAYGKVSNNLIVFRDGDEALQHLKDIEELPDICLLDLNMPKHSGWSILSKIKSDEKLSQMPIIVLSVTEHERDIQSAYNLNANYFISKPSDFNDFVSIVKFIQNFWFNTLNLSTQKN
jgi:chemotaxis family two-component system response regulator Rcp1